MPALLYGLEAWGKINKDEINEIEKIQGREYLSCQFFLSGREGSTYSNVIVTR